jgi:proline dehydrogenase
MSHLSEYGIGSILDLSIEADIDENGNGSLSADDVVFLMVKCIESAASQQNSFVALKLTGLSNPTVLQNWTSALKFFSESFDKFDLDKDGKLNLSDFLRFVREQFGEDKENVAKTLFEHANKNKDGLIDKFEFIDVLSLDNLHARPLLICNDDFFLKQQDFEDYDKMVNRLKELCEVAQIKKVRLMIDAEQTYFQPAIDYVAMKFSKKYNKLDNKNGPIIFNTYQMYLKDSTERLIQNYNLSSRDQFVFAAKLVRGAYLFSERKRAEKLGYPDPIHNTLEDTHAAYDYAVEFLLKKLVEFQKRSNRRLDISNSPMAFMIASHNKQSILKTLKQMKNLEISPKSGLVLFGQLLGILHSSIQIPNYSN